MAVDVAAARSRYTALLLAALALAGCYPDLDWRKLAPGDSRFQVLVPARAQSESRSIGGAVMTIWSATARDALFGVSQTDYPDAARLHLAEARDALARNLSGSIVEDHTDSAPPRGTPTGGDPPANRIVTIQGSARAASGAVSRPVTVHARFHAVGNRLYQLVVIAPPDALGAGDLEMFFASFELR